MSDNFFLNFMGTPFIDPTTLLIQIVLILLLGLLAKFFSDKTKIPFPILLIFLGSLLASTGYFYFSGFEEIAELVRTVALIIIVFSAGFSLNFSELKSVARSVVWLSSLGVVITFSIITLVVFNWLSLSIFSAALIGAVLSGTDPAAISSALEKRGPSKIKSVLLTESILNSPLTIIFPLVVLSFVAKPFSVSILSFPFLFFSLIVSVFIGYIFFLVGRFVLNYFSDSHSEIVSLGVAITPYVVAEFFSGFGIIAVATTAILLSLKKIPQKKELRVFSSELAFLFTIFVFVLLGLQFSFSDLMALSITRVDIIVVALALVVARLVSVFISLIREDFSFKEKCILAFVSPRGISAAAITPLLISAGIVNSDSVLKIVYLGIIISILISLFILEFAVKLPPASINEKRDFFRKLRKSKSASKSNLN